MISHLTSHRNRCISCFESHFIIGGKREKILGQNTLIPELECWHLAFKFYKVEQKCYNSNATNSFEYSVKSVKMIPDLHSILGKHVTKWVKSTTRTPHIISISYKADYQDRRNTDTDRNMGSVREILKLLVISANPFWLALWTLV